MVSHQTKISTRWSNGTRPPHAERGFDPPRWQVPRRWLIAGVAGALLVGACGGSQPGSSKGSTSSSQPASAPTVTPPAPAATQPSARQGSSAGPTIQAGSGAAMPAGIPKDLVYPGATTRMSISGGTGYTVSLVSPDQIGQVVTYYKGVLGKPPYKNLATQTTTSGNASEVMLMFDNTDPNGITGMVLIGIGTSADSKGKTEIVLEVGKKT